MNKAMVLLAGSLTAVSLVAPAVVQSAAPAPKETAAPAQKPANHKVTAPRHVTGEVMSVNQEAKTLTVKQGPKGKELTFAVDPEAAARLSDLKAGDQVKIGYVKTHDQLMAKDLVKSGVAKTK